MSVNLATNRRYSNTQKTAGSKSAKSPRLLNKRAKRASPLKLKGDRRLRRNKIPRLANRGIHLPIGAEVRHYRQLSGLSMSEISRLTGISHSVISQLESGCCMDASGAVMARLCKLFNVSIDKFYSGEHHE